MPSKLRRSAVSLSLLLLNLLRRAAPSSKRFNRNGEATVVGEEHSAHPFPSSAATPPWLWFWVPLFLFLGLNGYAQLAAQDFAAAFNPPYGGVIAQILLISLAI